MPDSDCQLSAAAVETAASSVRARFTYGLLESSDPGYPVPCGGDFWTGFMRSLEGRWEQAREDRQDADAREPDPQLTLTEATTAADGGASSNG